MLNALPTVVTEPGEYATRDGRRVTIHEIRDTAFRAEFPDCTAFAAKGTLHTLKGKRVVTDYNVWHVSGRNMPLEETSVDIVGPWKGAIRQ